jgi:hypothetical protein
MKVKLSQFSDFAKSLLPEEVLLASYSHKFKDPDNIEILRRTVQCAVEHDSFTGFDQTLDKRKYTYVKNWILRKLESIDVDEQYDWMVDTERMVMHDNIEPLRERQLIQLIEGSSPSDFYFLKLYELTIYFYHFAQIRMKESTSEEVRKFIEKNEYAYVYGRKCLEEMAKITQDVIDFYLGKSELKVEGEIKLCDFYKDTNLPGMIRYYALVRLTFLYYIQNRLEQILPFYDIMQNYFLQGKYYSKRILSNFYSNLLIIHSKLNNLEQAERYGKYSIHYKNNDYLHYLNNLAAVQLRLQKNDKALETLKCGLKEARQTDNFHNKQGFTALFVKALSEKGQLKAAEKYGETFIENHRKDVLKARWHLFFTTYFQVLWGLERYRRIISLTRGLDLLNQEERLKSSNRYAPVLALFYYLSLYQEGKLDGDQLIEHIRAYNIELKKHPEYNTTLQQLQKKLKINFESMILKNGSDYIFL